MSERYQKMLAYEYIRENTDAEDRKVMSERPEHRYHMTTNYNDGFRKDEYTDDIISALEAAAIYLRDPDCWRVAVFDTILKSWTIDYMR